MTSSLFRPYGQGGNSRFRTYFWSRRPQRRPDRRRRLAGPRVSPRSEFRHRAGGPQSFHTPPRRNGSWATCSSAPHTPNTAQRSTRAYQVPGGGCVRHLSRLLHGCLRPLRRSDSRAARCPWCPREVHRAQLARELLEPDQVTTRSLSPKSSWQGGVRFVRDVCGRKEGGRGGSGLWGERVATALRRKPVNLWLGTGVLPHDCVGDRGAGVSIPDDGGLALVCDTDRGDLGGRGTRSAEYVKHCRCDTVPHLEGVMFNPAGLRKNLFVFTLRGRGNAPVSSDKNRSR